jgi:hypothetical protein
MTEGFKEARMTPISRVEYEKFTGGLDGFCDYRMMVIGVNCCEGCPCGDNDQCLLRPIRILLKEHIKEE